MDRKKRVGCLVFLVLSFCICNQFSGVSGTKRVTGVERGNFVIYTVNSTLTSNYSVTDLIFYGGWMRYLQDVRWNVSVESISDVSVSWQITREFKNGSTVIEGSHTNVDTGASNGFVPYWFFVSANLSIGDSVYTVYLKDVHINETIFRTYAGAPREVNHANFSLYNTFSGWSILAIWDCYFDRISGALLEGFHYERASNGISYHEFSLSAKIADSDFIPEFPSILILSILMIATLLAAIVYRREHSK